MIADLKPYKEYERTGLSWLPKLPVGWKIQRTKTAFRLRLEKSGRDHGKELLSIYTHIGVRPRKDLEEKGNKASTTDDYWRVEHGDIVVNKLLAWMGAVGVSHFDGVTSPAYDILQPMSPLVTDYYHHLFRTKLYLQQFKARSRGIMEMRLRLYFDELGQIPLVMPPLDEQALIVRFLDWVSVRLGKAIAAKRKVIGLLEEQKQVIIHRGVTRGLDDTAPIKPSGIDWLGEVPNHWKKVRLRQTVKDCTNGIWGNDPDGSDDVECFRVADFDRFSLKVRTPAPTVRSVSKAERRGRLLRPGDLLLEKSGGEDRQPVGCVVIYDGEATAVCSNFVAKMSVAESYNPRFTCFLHSGLYSAGVNVRSIKQTTGIQNLDSKAYLSEHVFVPDLVEQEAIAVQLDKALERFVAAIDTLRKEISLIREYQTRLVADVVTGKLDVREFAKSLPDDVSEEAAELAATETLDENLATDDELIEEVV